MAIDMTVGTVGTPAGLPHRECFKVIDMVVDFAEVVTTKGSAIVATDVIETLDIPANTYTVAAGLEVVTAMTGTSTNSALDLGFTGGDVDNFVDGFDFDGASVGDFATPATVDAGWIWNATADTLDILVETLTGTITGGKLRVFAIVADCTGINRPGVAAAGS